MSAPPQLWVKRPLPPGPDGQERQAWRLPTHEDVLRQLVVQEHVADLVNKLRSAEATIDRLDGDRMERLELEVQQLRKFVRVIESECRNELVRGELQGMSKDGPHTSLWTNLMDRARALLVVTEGD